MMIAGQALIAAVTSELVTPRPSAPSTFDWWSSIFIPAGVGVLSVVVAATSVFAALRATKIAKASEEARVLAESERLRTDKDRHKESRTDAYTRKLEESLISLFRGVAIHLQVLQDWIQKASFEEEHGYNWNPNIEDFEYDPDPYLFDVIAYSDAVRLIARGKDREVANAAHDVFVVLDSVSGFQRRVNLGALLTTLREWRTGELTADAAIAFMRRTELDLKPTA